MRPAGHYEHNKRLQSGERSREKKKKATRPRKRQIKSHESRKK